MRRKEMRARAHLENLLFHAHWLLVGIAWGAYFSLLFNALHLGIIAPLLLMLLSIVGAGCCLAYRSRQINSLMKEWVELGEENIGQIAAKADIAFLYGTLATQAIYGTPSEFKRATERFLAGLAHRGKAT